MFIDTERYVTNSLQNWPRERLQDHHHREVRISIPRGSSPLGRANLQETLLPIATLRNQLAAKSLQDYRVQDHHHWEVRIYK